MKTNEILKIGLIAGGGFLLWNYFFKDYMAGRIGAPVASADIPGVGRLDITRTKTELANDVVARLQLPTADTAAKKAKKKKKGKFGKFLGKVVKNKLFQGVVGGAMNIVAPGSGTAFTMAVDKFVK